MTFDEFTLKLSGWKTIIASVISLLASLAGMAGIVVDDTILTNGIIAVVSTVAAIWFRYTATRNLQDGGKLEQS